MAAVLGVSPYRTRLDVWLEKTRHPMWRPKAQTPAMRWGHILEPVVRAEYTADTGLAVIPAPPRMTFDDPELAWWARDEIRFAHPDGLVQPDGVWEGKTGSNDDDWEFGVPIWYRVQVQQYIDIMERAWGDVSVLLPGGDFRTYREPADLGLQLEIIEEAARFWRFVKDGISPDPLEPTYMWPTAAKGKTVEPTLEIEETVLNLLATKVNIKQAEAVEKELADRIKTFMEDAETMEGSGWKVTLGNPKPPTTVGWEQVATSLWNSLEMLRRFRQHLPDEVAPYLDANLYDTLVGMYSTTGATTRPLKVNPKKER